MHGSFGNILDINLFRFEFYSSIKIYPLLMILDLFSMLINIHLSLVKYSLNFLFFNIISTLVPSLDLVSKYSINSNFNYRS